MSFQGNQHIWEIDFDPKKTIVSLINRKFIKDLRSFKEFLLAIEKQTECFIRVTGLEKENDNIWISFQSSSKTSRENAFLIVNTATGNSCKVFELPKLEETNSQINGTTLISHEEDDEDKYKLVESSNSIFKRSPLVRSSTTDNFSSSKLAFNSSNTINDTKSSPFSSVLSKLKMTKIEDNQNGEQTLNDKSFLDNNKTSSRTVKKQEVSNRYSVDFLLDRADAIHSKKMPANWKELNEKYPDFCFYGKVISYFNPHKYWAHWNKTINLNPILHNTLTQLTPQSNDINFSKRNITTIKDHQFHTDDFINLKAKNQQYQTSASNGHQVNNNHRKYKFNNDTDVSFYDNNNNYPHFGSKMSNFSSKQFMNETPRIKSNNFHYTPKSFNSHHHTKNLTGSFLE